MRPRTHLWFFSSFILFLTGCVTHSPVSDSFIFQDPSLRRNDAKRTRIGLVLNHGLSYGTARKAGTTKWPSFGEELSPLNPKQRSIGLYVVNHDNTKRSSFGLTLGTFSAGLDITYRLFGRNYITGAFSGPAQGQLYIMHRILNGSLGGIALGPGYKTLSFAFEDESTECTFCIENRRNGTHSFGVQSVGLLRFSDEEAQGLKVGAYAGYIPKLDQAVFSFTLTIGGI
ncbi:MAG: hypothetical protein KTR29_07295 [Rhodothermaceae bacterium]|nr:hypothetical protein [Rhodothermaceae bacterium]